MKAEDFDRASIQELQVLANKCFEMAQSPLEEPPLSVFGLDDAGKLRLLLEAQFYLTAVARKRDERVANRDFWLEIAVIVLIAGEIILSIVGIRIAIREGEQQARVFSNIERSTSDTAGAMSEARQSLENLTSSQTQSRDYLKQMDSNLRSSQTTTAGMASATRKQLQILQDEQATRLSRLAMKPKLVLYVEEAPINALTVSFKARNETDTSMTFDFKLVNEGNAIATRPLMRVIVQNKEVSVQTTPPSQPVVQPPDSANQTFLLSLDNMRPKVRVPMTIIFTYPAGTVKPFDVIFNVDADEIDTGTLLGVVKFKPRSFSNR